MPPETASKRTGGLTGPALRTPPWRKFESLGGIPLPPEPPPWTSTPEPAVRSTGDVPCGISLPVLLSRAVLTNRGSVRHWLAGLPYRSRQLLDLGGRKKATDCRNIGSFHVVLTTQLT